MKASLKELNQLLTNTINRLLDLGIKTIDMPSLEGFKYTFGLPYLTDNKHSFVLSVNPVYNKKDKAAARLELNLHEVTNLKNCIIASSKIYLVDSAINKAQLISNFIAVYLNLAREKFSRNRYCIC